MNYQGEIVDMLFFSSLFLKFYLHFPIKTIYQKKKNLFESRLLQSLSFFQIFNTLYYIGHYNVVINNRKTKCANSQNLKYKKRSMLHYDVDDVPISQKTNLNCLINNVECFFQRYGTYGCTYIIHHNEFIFGKFTIR